jgi:hypothetical protein
MVDDDGADKLFFLLQSSHLLRLSELAEGGRRDVWRDNH